MRREWPTVAAEVRDQAAEEAQKPLNSLTPLLTGGLGFTQEEYRKIAVAINCQQNILRLLESQGAKTTPLK